jgi:hypothetical protein
MCAICGHPGFVRCNCQSAQPFCDQCQGDTICAEVMDSSCVIYHFQTSTYTPPPTRLINLNLPNGSSAQTIFEAVDAALGSIKPWVAEDTSTIHLFTSGLGLPVVLQGNVKISAVSGNTISAKSDGIYSPSPIYSGQVRVDSTSPLRYLANSVIGGTDGCVTIDVVDQSGLLAILPNLDVTCLAGLICSAPTDVIQELTACLLTSGLTAEDSSTLHLSLGSFPMVLQGNVKISASSGNTLFAKSDGLFVSGSTQTPISANNALSVAGSTVQLGGPLIQNTSVGFATGSFYLRFNSTPQIVVGEGTPSGTGLIEIQNTYASGFNFNAGFVATTTTALRASGGGIGSFDNLIITGGTDTDVSVKAGTYGQIFFNSSVTLNSSDTEVGYAGVHGIIVPTTTGTVVSGTAIPAGVMGGAFARDNATITSLAALSARAIYQAPGGSAFSGTITNYYGLYMEDLSTGLGSHITNRFAIYQTGTSDASRFFGPVQNAGGTTQFTSDARVKENISGFSRGLKEIEQISTYNFNYIYNKQTKVAGIIAQELEGIMPEAIYFDRFEVPGRDEIYDDFRFVDTNVIFYAMLNAIKELSIQNKNLKARLDNHILGY